MRKKIKKFNYGTWGGGLYPSSPGTLNTGFDLYSQITSLSDIGKTNYARDVGYPRSPAPKGTANIDISKYVNVPQIGPDSNSFEAKFPMINMAANNGDVNAMKMKFDHAFNLGMADLQEAGKLKNPFSGKPLEIPEPSTFQSDGENNLVAKTPFAETKAGKGVAIAGQSMNMLGEALNSAGIANYKLNGNLETRKNISAAGRLVASMFGPWGMLAAGADSVVEALGGKSDVSEGLGTANDVGNMVASIALPGLGWALGKTDKYSLSEDIKKSSAYTGEAAAGERVAKNAGAKILFGRGTANENTRIQKRKDRITEGVLADARDAKASSGYLGTSLRNLLDLSGGPKVMRTQKGGRLDLLAARRIVQLVNSQKEIPVVEVVEIAVEEFREGGKLNVIPDGALHKNRHHMEDVDDNFKELTNKGIPVITEEGGKLILQAEIERDEIIFNIDVTKKLEELLQDGSDGAAIEAGRLLALEIMENTIDNTGLMKEIL